MFAPAIRSHMAVLALGSLVAAACLFAAYAAWLMPDDSLGVGATPLARLEGLFTPAAASADLPLDTFLPGDRQNLTPDQAVAANLASPLARVNPPPPAFNPAWLAPADLVAANGEPSAGQLAVAQVILNRLRHPRFPKTVCAVVHQGSDRATGCQFTFTCDGSLARSAGVAGMMRARMVASAALHGAVSFAAGQATHYHTIWIVPVWAHQMSKVAIVGHHVFYRPPGSYGGWPALAGGAVVPAPQIAPDMAPAAVAVSGGNDGAVLSPNLPSNAPPPVIVGQAVVPVAGPLAAAPAAGKGTIPAKAQPAPMFGDTRRRQAALALPSQ